MNAILVFNPEPMDQQFHEGTDEQNYYRLTTLSKPSTAIARAYLFRVPRDGMCRDRREQIELLPRRSKIYFGYFDPFIILQNKSGSRSSNTFQLYTFRKAKDIVGGGYYVTLFQSDRPPAPQGRIRSSLPHIFCHHRGH